MENEQEVQGEQEEKMEKEQEVQGEQEEKNGKELVSLPRRRV